MNEPGDFLSRWSRRKRAAVEGLVEQDKPAADASQPEEARATPVKAAPEPAPAEPAFDITKLPSIDSIGPETDVRVFLQPGVPAALRHAALRRVWVSDPAIRDFRAPQEMDWDFNSPGLPGFGEIGPDVDVKKMAARILGGASAEDAEQEAPAAIAEAQSMVKESDSAAADAEHTSPPSNQPLDAASPLRDVAMLQSEEDIASQQGERESSSTKPRRHGRALPQ